ncbi:DUF6288 domain-containing protein [Rubellicoccus peritrichatus]|uniref:DUF6288 domain-containing protein n=1 Tax=Rubellicoccus peritrichatus TaxID=3080537 RepID=A0AAQ3QW34_9BACT|nr:DUF6288 domain-containing protein [Puniceicoccus sp. CR14]WOO41477.1 DUF6288 domain-containing protein [Puniceicoccus sp. CR14]
MYIAKSYSNYFVMHELLMKRWPIFLLLIFVLGASRAQAVSNHPFQVGPTGFTADWDSGDDYVTVTDVRGGGPADGFIEVGDKIWAVNGTSLADSYFTNIDSGRHHDPRVALGNAITDSEAGDGQIVFDVERGGSREDRTVQLAITNTAYSATWPKSCPKSDLIIQKTGDKYVAMINDWLTWKSGGHMSSFIALFLLSTGEEEHLDAVRTLMDSLDVQEVRTGANNSRTNNWYSSLQNIALAEYCIRTGDTRVLPNLQNFVNKAFATESVGGWGHGWSVGQTGYVQADYVGSGLVNAVGGQVFVGVALARECGVDMTDADFEKSLRYYYQTAGVGAPIYGDHRYSEGGAVNGKLSLIGAGLSMLNEPYASAAKMIGAMDGYNADNFEGGHSGNFGNVLWRSITSGLNGDDDSYRYMMDTMRWYFELCRDYDGTFTLLPAFSSTRYSNNSWGAMVGLNYTAARNQLRMTGAPPTVHSVIRHVPEVIPKHHEYFLITHAEGYTDADYGDWMGEWKTNSSLDDIRKHMRHWHPKVRYHASMAIGHRATDANLDPVNFDGDPDNDLTDPAVDLVIEAMESDDARVRTAGLKGITGLAPFFLSDFEDFDYDSDDYRRMAPYVLDILRDPDSDHWELDAATWAMNKMPTDIVRDNVDALLPLLEYEYVWFVRVGAFRALSRLSGPDLAPHFMALLDCYVMETSNTARNAMYGNVQDDINNVRDHISDAQFQQILDILGDDVSGGVYPRDQGYQGAGGHVYESQTMDILTETFTVEELGTIADDINSVLSRFSNGRLQGLSGQQTFFNKVARWHEYYDLSRGTPEEISKFLPGFKALLLRGENDIVTWDDRYGEAEYFFEFIIDELNEYESANGLVQPYRSYDFTADPAMVLGPDPAPFPDHEDQGIHYKLENGSGTVVQNHGMNGFSADAEMTDPAGWSSEGIAPFSNYSLDANKAWVFADNPHLVDRETSSRIEERIRDGSYITSAWIRLNDTLPDEDAHYVVLSALYDFDFGVRRLDVGGEWKNTLFFTSADWGNAIYAMNDSNGRSDIFLNEGTDYFIMFERRRNGDGDDKTLLHLYEPTQNIWLTSNGDHTLGNKDLDTRSFHVGIGSIDSDVLDPATRFPGLIDSVQMWSHVNKVNPQTFAGRLTLARQNGIKQITEQPGVYQEAVNVDGTSALIHNHLVKTGPIGSVLTIYYGDEDGGMDPANWDHSHTFPASDSLDPLEYVIEGLAPDGVYYTRAYVQNPVGAMLEYWTPEPLVITTLTAAGDTEDPVAHAGSNVVVIDDDRSGTATVTLDGSASTDNIAIETYTWTDQSNNVLSTGSDYIQTVELTPGFYIITLTTTDFQGNSSQSQFEVDVFEGVDDTAPTADAGVDQQLVDYDQDGFCMVEFDGSGSGGNGVTPANYTWEIEGNVVATGENPYVTLPVGNHFVVMTVEGPGGAYNQDSFEVEIISADEAMLTWAQLDRLDNHVIIAAQDFNGMGEGLVKGSGERRYTESSAPNREVPFWPFIADIEEDRDSVKAGVTELNDPLGQEAFIVDTRGSGLSISSWWYYSDPIDVSAYSNCRIAAEMQLYVGNYSRSSFYRSKIHMELENGDIEVQELFFKTDFASTGPFIRTYDIPSDVKYVWIEVSGRSLSRWMGVDNIIVVGQVPEPATVVVQNPDQINPTTARVKGNVIDNGRENPRIKVYYGSEDRGETTVGWDGVADLGTRGGSFTTTLTGLSELTTYYYRVHAENAAGETFSPTAASFRTASTTPIDPPSFTVLPVTDLTTTSATINGRVDDTGGDTPRVRIFFGVQDRGNTTSGWDHEFDLGYVDGDFSQLITGLDPYRAYNYRIYAQNFGNSVWSDLGVFATKNPEDSIYISIQSNVDMSAASWDRGSIPGVGDIAIIDDNLRFDFSDGWSFDADNTLLSKQIRIEDSITFNDITLYEGSELQVYASYDTVAFNEIHVLESGKLTYRENRSGAHFTANTMIGDGELIWSKNGGGESQLNVGDMTGFTGLLQIGGLHQSSTPLDLTQDIAIEDASFAMNIVGNGNRFVLSGDIAVTNLTVDKDYFSTGTYTLDTANNPGAIDLSNLNGRDYSPFFENSGGTITVTVAPPAIGLPEITVNEATDITVFTATLNGEVIEAAGQSPRITLFYGLTDQGPTFGWDGQIDLGIHSRDFSHILDALSDNTTYYYRFYVENSAGGFFADTTETFTTLELREPIVEAKPALAILSTTARVQGNITDDGNDPTTVTFYYGNSDGGNVAGNWANAIEIGEHRNGRVSTLLEGLTPNATYYYRIHVSNAGGENWSDTAQQFVAAPDAGLVYLHRFNNESRVHMNGITPDYTLGSEVWENDSSGASYFYDDGYIGTNKRRGIWLPFTPVQGKVYTLSADIISDRGNEGIALSYAQYDANNHWNTTSVNSYGTALIKSEGEGRNIITYTGTRSAGASTIPTDYVPDYGYVHVSIVLDATDADSANWTMEFFIDGVSVRDPGMVSDGDFGDIRYIGLSRNTGGGAVRDFSFTARNPSSSPSIVAQATMGITKTTADVHAEVTDTGGETPNVILLLGSADQGETTSGWDASIDLGNQDSIFSVTLTGLDADSTYHYRLYAENSAGSAFSSAMSFTTLAPQPPVVEALSASAVSNGKARFKGSLIDDGNQATEIAIYYGLVDGINDSKKWYHSINLGTQSVGDFSVVLDDLIEGMTYHYRIHATNADGSSWSSTAQSFSVSQPIDLTYLDYFGGANGQALLGESPSLNTDDAVWDNADSSSTAFRADGEVISSQDDTGLWLPLTIRPDYIYTLSAEVECTTGDADSGIAISFAQYNPNDHLNVVDDSDFASIRVPSENNGRVAYVENAFTGTNTTVAAVNVPDAGFVPVKIVLDTRAAVAANWTMEFFVNGVSVSGPVTASSGLYGSLRYVGITKSGGSGTIRDFTLVAKDTGGPEGVIGTGIYGSFDAADSRLVKAFYFGYSPSDSFAKVRFEVKPESGSPVIQLTHERSKEHTGVGVVYEFSTDLREWNLIEDFEIINETTEDTSEGMENVDTLIFKDLDGAFFRARLVPSN